MKNSDKSFARYLLVQSLYQMITSKSKIAEVVIQLENNNFETIPLDFNDSNILKNKIDLKYFKNIVFIFSKNEQLIFELIKTNLSKNWNYERLPNVLKAILISSVSEILANPEISIGIVTSEYIKLTESFFLGKESSFVNAFISKVYSLDIGNTDVK